MRCPAPLRHVWEAFLNLSSRRDIEVAGTTIVQRPISYANLAGFIASMKPGLSVWERELVLDVDDAVLPILNKAKPVSDGIPVTDTRRAKASFQRAAAARKGG